MAYTALQLSTNALYQAVTQVAHGFSVGQVVRFDGVDFVLADNTSEPNSEVVGMVSSIINADQFYITQHGFVVDLTTIPTEGGVYSPGVLYYLSDIPGELTSIKPVAVGDVELPCFIAYTDTDGFFFASVGTLIEAGSLFSWTEIDSNQMLEVNQGYYVNGVGALNDLLLPATASPGDTIEIWDIGGNGFTITQDIGQSIIVGTGATAVGIGGSIESTALGNKLIINCVTVNVDFICDISMSAGASIIVT